MGKVLSVQSWFRESYSVSTFVERIECFKLGLVYCDGTYIPHDCE